MQLSRKQSHCEVPEVRILHIPRWGSSTTPEGKCLPLVLACLEMKAADASVNGDLVGVVMLHGCDRPRIWHWCNWIALRSPKPSMLVRVQHAVLSLSTGCGKGLRSRLAAALVLADPPSLREQSPELLRRLLLLDAWQSGLLHHLAKVATGNGPGVRLPQHPRAVAGGKKPFFAIGFPYGGLG